MSKDIHSNKKPKRKEKVMITIKFRSSQCSLCLSLIHVYTSAALRQVLKNHVALLWARVGQP